MLTDRVDLDEVTIEQLQARMASGALTARQLVEAYLERIEAVDRGGPRLRSIIEANPDALEIADALDRERADRHVRGPLHGMPIVLKDNIDTADRMQTTAGSLALLGVAVTEDAPAPEAAPPVEPAPAPEPAPPADPAPAATPAAG